ncbi:hypothetical protein N7U66_05380 [Lacinutrix neustonica]|nr:hypothetical protein [Lacinutrix neustonica]WAC03061.1 hypothetical protein N7U66_05380 [Lacinutrix neustonica]
MKIKLTILFIIFVSIQLFGQNESEKEESLRVKNRIGEKLTYEFNLETNDSILIDQDFYNKNGKHIKDLRFNEKGEIRYSYTIEHNSKGLMEKQTGYKFGEISTILTYKYDENGNRTDNFQHKRDGTLLIHQKRTYNKKNLNTELHNKRKNSEDYFRSSKYYYNKDGKYSKIKSFNPNGKLIRLSEYEYDKKGNKSKVYNIKNGNKDLTVSYEYDDKNNLIKRLFIKSNKHIEYKYDNENNLIEEKTFEKNILTKKVRFSYKKIST